MADFCGRRYILISSFMGFNLLLYRCFSRSLVCTVLTFLIDNILIISWNTNALREKATSSAKNSRWIVFGHNWWNNIRRLVLFDRCGGRASSSHLRECWTAEVHYTQTYVHCCGFQLSKTPWLQNHLQGHRRRYNISNYPLAEMRCCTAPRAEIFETVYGQLLTTSNVKLIKISSLNQDQKTARNHQQRRISQKQISSANQCSVKNLLLFLLKKFSSVRYCILPISRRKV